MPCQLLNEHLLLPEHFCLMSHCHPDFEHPFHLFEAVTCHIGWVNGLGYCSSGLWRLRLASDDDVDIINGKCHSVDLREFKCHHSR